MARTKPAAVRRVDLLDAAEALVVRVGADGFTVEDVVNGAGVAKGTFYLHFSSKADLLEALRLRYAERFAARQREAAREGTDAERLQAWVRCGVDAYLGERALHDVLFHPPAFPRDGLSSPNLVVDGLVELLEGFDAPPEDPLAAAVVLFSALHGTADHIVHDPGSRERMLRGLDALCRALTQAPK